MVVTVVVGPVAVILLFVAVSNGETGELVTLVGNDDELAEDHAAVSTSLVNLRDWLGSECSVPPGAWHNFVLVIEPDGSVRGADVTGGRHQDNCLEKAVSRAAFSRVGDTRVRFEGDLKWAGEEG